MRPAERLERIPPYLFAELERKIAEKKAAGVDVISLGIGDPDMPTSAAHRRGDGSARCATRARTSTRRTAGRTEFREAVAAFYAQAVRRRARPRDAGDAGDRRQGVHLPPQLRLPRRGRRGARRRSRLPGLHRRAAARGRRAGADAAACPSAASCPTSARSRRDARARAADVPQLPEQPDRRGRAGRLLRARRSRSRASTTCSSCTTTPTPS